MAFALAGKRERIISGGGGPEVDDRRARWEAVRLAAAGCQDCPLWEIGTQTVFGAGPVDAGIMFVGEAPGRLEDESGQPFVGPAGQLFDRALLDAQIDRSRVYVTNTVKHRPSVASPGGRKNRAPKQSEITACAQWLDREIAIIQPRIICCLGAVAAKRLLGKDFALMKRRGEWLESDIAPHVLATVHPSFVMLQRNSAEADWYGVLVSDLVRVRDRSLEIMA